MHVSLCVRECADTTARAGLLLLSDYRGTHIIAGHLDPESAGHHVATAV